MTEENEISYYPSIKQSWGIVGISLLIMALFSFIYLVLNQYIDKSISFFIYYILSMGIIFWIAHKKKERVTGASIYNFNSSSFKNVILVSVAVISIQIGITTPLVSMIPMPDSFEKIFLEVSKRTDIFSFITIAIAAPIFEELIFRGVILDGLLKRYSPFQSIFISSVLFGVMHLNPWQFITALVIGMFSGWAYYNTRSLTLSILIHFVNNLAAFSSRYFLDTEALLDQSLTKLYGGLLSLIVFISGGIIVTVICLYFLRLEFKKAQIN
ncbi:CPBP family intramembrane glutamic endopeptidase [Ohtaekwangia koreensis]|uniref:CAAX prenyl protease 2/Lysostaphin resistance protein A-like domain-containing protein n=1 Tax=Ohtaekwangia koreensis TaxID=688867 RepID=A0A1T5LAR6_9BACT|nr:type II CAAX endopeptidase family protein [Ohtaekwangia koreensis]SKC73071.1 hypothetical protein SAMN05660236_2852 [Ohtaekwangia koreensis]